MQPSADTGRLIAGRYRLQASIGRGSMGVVWRARDQLLDRDVAIKEVHIADTLTEEELATAYRRTLREAKTAARLNHPAVVTVYDVAEDGGRPWIVMQLVSAQSLDQVLATSGPLSPRRAAEMARQLLSALSVAHAAGVMHRDVKPSNVLLDRDNRAVLTDFGIATFADDPKLTQTGMVMGSPGFTAPERIRGEDASPASDLWSLGATLFAAVEGHGPFEKRGGAITTMSAIINEDPPEASTAGPLGSVIAALLRRKPADRPNASAAVRMINNVLPLLPDRAPGTPSGYQATALSAASRQAAAPPGSAPPGSAPPGSAAPGPAPPGSAPPGPAPPGSAPPGPAPPGSAPPGPAPPGSAAPGPIRPWPPSRGETALDFPSAQQTAAKEPPGFPAASTGPPVGQASAEQTAPTVPQPVHGDGSRYGQSQSSWGQGASAGYAPGASAGSAARPQGPPPLDFSSWYDPSPRSGSAAPPGSGSAWSGPSSSQHAYGSPPWPGSASQPAPGSPPWPDSASQPAPGSPPSPSTEDTPDRRQPSGGWWKIAVAALAIIGAGAGAATVVLLHQNHADGPNGGTTATGSSSGSPTGSLPPASLQIVNAVNMPTRGPLPSGFRTISRPASADGAAGFSIGAPTSWKESTRGDQTYLTDPADPNTNILIDLTPHAYPNDLVKEAEYVESESIPRFPGYQRIGLAATPIRGTSGAYWKFTWTDKGVEQEAIDLLFVAHTSAGPQPYALYMTAPTAEFNQERPVFDAEVETFAPVPR